MENSSSSKSTTTINALPNDTLQAIDDDIDSLVQPTLARMTKGLPRHELKLILMEAQECEDAIMKEIRLLEAAAGLPVTPITTDPTTNVEFNKSSSTEKGASEIKSSKTNKAADASTTKKSNGNDSGTKDTEKDTDSKQTKTTENNNSSSNDDTTKTSSNESKSDESKVAEDSLAMGGWAYDAMGGLNYHSTVDALITSEITPMDRYFSLSAMLGRLRIPLDLPPVPQASDFTEDTTSTSAASTSTSTKNNPKSNNNTNKDSSSNSSNKSNTKKSGSSSSNNSNSSSNANSNNQTVTNPILDKQQQSERKQKLKFLEKQKALLALESNPIYHKPLEQTQLLALWKRISSHRTCTVFRRPVSSKDGMFVKLNIPIIKCIQTQMIFLEKSFNQVLSL